MARTGISIEAGTAPGNREAEPMETRPDKTRANTMGLIPAKIERIIGLLR